MNINRSFRLSRHFLVGIAMLISFVPDVTFAEGLTHEALRVRYILLPEGGAKISAETRCERSRDCVIYRSDNDEMQIKIHIEEDEGFSNTVSIDCSPAECFFDNGKSYIRFGAAPTSFDIRRGKAPNGLEMRSASRFGKLTISYRSTAPELLKINDRR
ncbi:hypothetical protein FHT82_005764 [Rhizobium sp. BK275]|uniref:hypothetical protein n=1 Tax=unclassified Rhizobium TaxID=2613769 RepID=UPI001611E141|nr:MULTISPECIES: hypothetical protein [unclassified Rhizobium]MBB3392975.1 hypothetical protein [Rhizobium sp. BK275]MBB3409611.1 hypothetical protein [Rhizobium sp. BK316]